MMASINVFIKLKSPVLYWWGGDVTHGPSKFVGYGGDLSMTVGNLAGKNCTILVG
jgi:hypothetical protein